MEAHGEGELEPREQESICTVEHEFALDPFRRRSDFLPCNSRCPPGNGTLHRANV